MSIELTNEERRTRELFAEYEASHDYSEQVVLVRHVFRAMYYAALSCERIEAMAQAMHPHHQSRRELQATLTTLCRAKVLRSRKGQGERLYEVNY